MEVGQGELTKKGHKEIWGVTEMFCGLTGIVTQEYTFVKMHSDA